MKAAKHAAAAAIVLVAALTAAGAVGRQHELRAPQAPADVASRASGFLWAAGAAVALACGLLVAWASRAERREWSEELRAAMHGHAAEPEAQALIAEFRNYLDTLAEGAPGDAAQPWTARRLRRTLRDRLAGEGVLIVANREPYLHERMPGGGIRVRHPASGMVSALEPVMRACSGVWIAHGSGSADREVVDSQGRVPVPPGEESYVLRRVWLSSEEERGYYYGFSNEGLWPLCHIVHTRPAFRREDWDMYQHVNRRFSEAACDEAGREDPIIFLQDYHFALAPRNIREALPRATILSFWHIPWPNAERLGICPWAADLLAGMLGSSIVGFHTQAHCNNFLDAVDRYLEARIDRANNAVVHQGRTTLVRPYPISIEWPNHWALQAPPPDECRRSIFHELRLATGTLLGVGVDRMDYTKGIEERFAAIELLMEQCPEMRGRFTFVQLAAPSRTLIGAYRELNDVVTRTAERVNSRFAQGRWSPILLLRGHHEPPAIFRFYRAADFCCVSSLHDGMNLVAKEFVAAREDEQGVLILSKFTGAAGELPQALIVNPYDAGETAEAMRNALSMSAAEQQGRMRAMRQQVTEFNVYRWAGRMIDDAARLREQGRVAESLEAHLRHPIPEPGAAT